MNYKFVSKNPSQPEKDTIYFIFDNWNDYGNCMMYGISVEGCIKMKLI